MKQMNDKVFLDTNIWIYLYSQDIDKKNKAETLISNEFDNIILSTQILNEIYNVLSKKIKISHPQIKEIIMETIANFEVSDIGALDVVKAMDIKDKYNFSYWDSLVIVSALENGCTILYSEDMQNKQLIESVLRIENPFIHNKKC
jgi:predicted nucleic acid-binding protein